MKNRNSTILVLLLTGSAFYYFIFYRPIPTTNCSCETEATSLEPFDYDVGNLKVKQSLNKLEKKKLAVVVPFRNCYEELLSFAPYMKAFLSAQKIPFHIFVVNQVDQFRFNRASLINVGFLYARDNFDYMVMHDVDLLPLNENLTYAYPNDGVFHIAAPYLHPTTSYDSNLGGILIVTNSDFERVDGMSNNFWGWGLEDDEFRENLQNPDHFVKIHRPEGLSTGKNNTFLVIHSSNRARDKVRTWSQYYKQNLTRVAKSGLVETKYNIKAVKDLKINDVHTTILDVELECNRSKTPWCIIEDNKEKV